MHTKETGSAALLVIIGVALFVFAGAWYFMAQSDMKEEAAMSETNSGAESSAAPLSNEDAVSGDATAPGEVMEKMEESHSDSMMKEDEKMMESDEAMMKKGEGAAMIEEAAMEEEASAMMEKPAEAPTVAGTFTEYSADKLALADSGDVVLFFHADWCPSCRNLERDITANTVPDNVHILKVDYDEETALKQKYGVTRQHTLVVVDSAGNKVKTLTGLTNTLAQVTNQL